MAAISGVNIAMLPEEQPEFWDFLATTGDVWACWLGHDPGKVQYEPAPVADFIQRFAGKIQNYDMVEVFIGLRAAVLKPRTRTDTQVIGGQNVRRTGIDHQASQLIWYGYGIINGDKVMNRTNTSLYSSYLSGNQLVRKPDDFLKWGKKVNAWLCKKIAGKVPVHQCNYEIPASALTIAAVKKGLKVV